MSHVPYKSVKIRVNESWRVYMSHGACKWGMARGRSRAKKSIMSCVDAHMIYRVKWHCNTLQHTATHCNTLQLTATHCNSLQLTATHCNVLQHTATHCNTLQLTATHCNSLQLTATHCNSLQLTAIHCNSLQHTATHCNTLQHTATHCRLYDPPREMTDVHVSRLICQNVSHVVCKWVMSHVNETDHSRWACVDAHRIHHVKSLIYTYHASWHNRQSHRVHKSCHVWMLHDTCKWLIYTYHDSFTSGMTHLHVAWLICTWHDLFTRGMTHLHDVTVGHVVCIWVMSRVK